MLGQIVLVETHAVFIGTCTSVIAHHVRQTDVGQAAYKGLAES